MKKYIPSHNDQRPELFAVSEAFGQLLEQAEIRFKRDDACASSKFLFISWKCAWNYQINNRKFIG